ncbi:MAG TPA: polyprenyl diphosphate synthase [Candidatus Egerieousia sp.]|nr:polyprenyl diphosphate synthase [Candidatus Egerieousia sp.]HPT05715.1 polyprenyl diphosphate synthase [Candidatus Egerieousia sp.]
MTQENKLPKHVTIIMDGNGRWAKQRGKERIEGHKEGVESVRACCELAVELGIQYLSVFAFSEENWGRPQDEIEGLWRIMLKAITAETPTFMKNNVRFRVIGNFSRLSKPLVKEIDDCMALTAGNTGTNLVVMLSYSGKWDIVQALNQFMSKHLGEQITEEAVESYLSTADIPDPDLLIRTSGEQRISNYMLWQTAYTEYYFTDVLWPDFRKTQFRQALDAYSKRERRYGKV